MSDIKLIYVAVQDLRLRTVFWWSTSRAGDTVLHFCKFPVSNNTYSTRWASGNKWLEWQLAFSLSVLGYKNTGWRPKYSGRLEPLRPQKWDIDRAVGDSRDKDKLLWNWKHIRLSHLYNQCMVVLGKIFWGKGWPLIIWKETTAKRNYYRTN